MLNVNQLTVRYGEKTVIHDIQFSLKENHWMMVVGPNGAGKSTIVNAISQLVPYTGQVLFQGQDIAGMKPVQLAKKMGVLSQTHMVTYSFTVGEIVRLGRYCYSPGIFGTGSAQDDLFVKTALELTGMADFENQSVLALSGGELQRTFLAQLFAQNPQLLLLDEPSNHLDLVYQKQLFEIIERWVAQPGRAVLSVVHDLSMARRYGTDILLLDSGRVACLGNAKTALNRQRLKQVYAVDVYAWMGDMLRQWEDRDEF